MNTLKPQQRIREQKIRDEVPGTTSGLGDDGSSRAVSLSFPLSETTDEEKPKKTRPIGGRRRLMSDRERLEARRAANRRSAAKSRLREQA